MKLIDCVEKSFIKQGNLQPTFEYHRGNLNYIDDNLKWSDTKEGDLFWAILNFSYSYWGFYDYISIIKIYLRFSKDIFKIQIYSDIKFIYKLNEPGNNTTVFEKLCDVITNEIKNGN